MSELQNDWTEAYKVAKTFCGKNSTSKKAFEKLTKSIDSKLSGYLKSIDEAVEASDRDAFDKVAAKAKTLLADAQTAYDSGLSQNLYKQNDVRAFFAAVTASKPDSISSKLRALTTEMNKIAKSPSKEQLASEKADRKADEKQQKADEKRQKERDAYASKVEKTKEAVLKVVEADAATYQEYKKKLVKIQALANERNGDLITAAKAYDNAKTADKAAAADEFRAIHETCGKLVAVIEDTLTKSPTTKKSEKAIAKAYPHGGPQPKEVSTGVAELKGKIALVDKELDDLVQMLNRTIGDKKPPKTDKEAQKDAKASADARQTSQQEAVARRNKMTEGLNKVREERAKAQQDDENRRSKQAKQSKKLNAQAEKAQNAVLKIIAADEAKLKKFAGEVQSWKMEAVGADGDLREARDAYQNDNSKADELTKARDACAALSAAYKKAEGSVPDCAKSEKAVDKVYPSGHLPDAVSEALDGVKAEQTRWAKELKDLHVMLDTSLSRISAPR